jgi:predicted deacylase
MDGETEVFELGGVSVPPGQRRTINLQVANLYTNAPVNLPVIVQQGRLPGPKLFVSAALHGDEIIGVEIIRRLLKLPDLEDLRGTLLAVPVVNVPAFLLQSRYLPDRRDLNRSFPGSETGSLAARLAHLFVNAVVGRCDFGIDLHTGAIHRPNMPQIRTDLSQPENLRLATAFGAPLLLNSTPAPGTLREYTTRKGIPMLLYESSEALRFDEVCIRIGVSGVQNVMRTLAMLPPVDEADAGASAGEPVIARSSVWTRAPASGILRAHARLGDDVRKGQALGIIGDPFGASDTPVTAPADGLVIGRLNLPLVYEGDALFHIARIQPSHADSEQGQEEAEPPEAPRRRRTDAPQTSPPAPRR